MSARLLSPSAFRLDAALVGLKDSFQWLEQVTRFWRAYETRQHLAALDEHMLRDIGITRMDACIETRRQPWDIRGI
ncbi:DUF1127 domain-containing protein [Roseococcus sp.]|uniref:DUF1127 domain-containing protein n=1 Tax=Roseococcus sp. TaxID=2109646 RepID=UPI003BACBDE5